MNNLREFIAPILLSVVLSTTWILSATLARMSDAIFLPQAIRYLIGALVLFICPIIYSRRLPQMSLRLLHASITIGGLAYFLSPLLCFVALQTLSSGLAALAFSAVPLFVLLLSQGGEIHRIQQTVIAFFCLSIVYVTLIPDNSLRSSTVYPVTLLIASVMSYTLGAWVAKRLFWVHSALDLNFWSMLFAAGINGLMGIVVHEGHLMQNWPTSYWNLLVFFGFIVTGMGSYFYRIRASKFGLISVTVLVPALALGWGIFLWGETPIEMIAVPPILVLMGILVLAAMNCSPSNWMVLYLHNDKRQGERLMCHIEAFIKKKNGIGGPGRIQVQDISVGGLGFRTDLNLVSGDLVVVSLPLGMNWNTLTLDCRIAHIRPTKSKVFPLGGGLEFQKLSEDRQQVLVEFLARLAKAEDVVEAETSTGT